MMAVQLVMAGRVGRRIVQIRRQGAVASLGCWMLEKRQF